MLAWWTLPAFVVATLIAGAVWWWRGQPVPLVDVDPPRVPCVSYAPFRGGETPFDRTIVIAPERIEADLRVLAGFTRCVRTYTVGEGLDAVPPLAEALGLRVLLGAWIGGEPDKNARQLARVVELANRHSQTVAAVIVGNEVLLRREQPAERLARMIAETRANIAVPVTYADVWEFWEKNPQVATVVDFVTIHTLPYWEDHPVAVEEAIEHVVDTWRRIQAQFPDRPVFIGEAGWPSAGRMREGARPSPLNQARFVRELLVRAAAEGIGINLIEAFDQPWKRRLEGTVGGHWGLFTADRQPKFPLAGPVAADPRWGERFAVATGLAAAGFTLLLAGGRGRCLGPAVAFAAALGLQLAAGTLVLAAAALAAAAGDAMAWTVGLIQLGLAAAATMLVAIAVLGQQGPAVPPAGTLLHALQTRVWPKGPALPVLLGLARLLLAIAAAALTVALVCAPRYRDFAVALYVSPALALFGHALWAAHRGIGTGPQREEWFLAAILAGGGVLVVLCEGSANVQALAWAATVLVLAGALIAGARRQPNAATGAERAARPG